MLLFPGLVATYLARPEHDLVVRLLRVARFALVLTAVVAWAAALRLALLDMSTTVAQLNTWFEPLAWVAIGLAGVLLASWILPLRLSHPIRRPFRGLALRLRHPPGRGFPRVPS